jgi:hypothetical protein
VLVPCGILGKAAVIETLGNKVGAVSASSLITVISRIIIDAVSVRVGNGVSNIIGI